MADRNKNPNSSGRRETLVKRSDRATIPAVSKDEEIEKIKRQLYNTIDRLDSLKEGK